jgi:hypothetical protein
MSYYRPFIPLILLVSLIGTAGCEVMPVVRYKPTLHNPLPQLRNVAVVPFYNETGNPNFDGRKFAACFANELQRIPGFNVVSNTTVEKTMLVNNLHKFENTDDIRYLAQLLKVDAIVIGKVHYFNDHYPPKVKFETEWYAANPYFHPIPAGRGLPWGTKHEEFIPDKVLQEAEMELATAQLETQSPKYEPVKSPEERQKEQQQQFLKQQELQKQQELKKQQQRRQPETPSANPQPEAPEVPTRTVRRNNNIRLVAATIPNNLNKDSLDEDELDEIAKYRQQQFLNKNLELTGVPYIPEAEPLTAEDRKKELLNKAIPEMPHPLQQGPWQSETAQKNENPWSEQNQIPPYQTGQLPNQAAAQTVSPEPYAWVKQQIPPTPLMYPMMPGMPVAEGTVEDAHNYVIGEPEEFPGLPKEWPDPRGFIPESPSPERPKGEIKNEAAVITHSSMYHGNDAEFMQALQNYDFLFRDDKRIAGKESILNDGTEFISFCCRMHLWEIFTTRGGAGQAEKVTRFYKIWKGGERPY